MQEFCIRCGEQRDQRLLKASLAWVIEVHCVLAVAKQFGWLESDKGLIGSSFFFGFMFSQVSLNSLSMMILFVNSAECSSQQHPFGMWSQIPSRNLTCLFPKSRPSEGRQNEVVLGNGT
jgi:hypothetical protein